MSGIVFLILFVLVNFNLFFSPRAVCSPSLCLLLADDLGAASSSLDEGGDEDDVGELPDELMSDVGGGIGGQFLTSLSISSFIFK